MRLRRRKHEHRWLPMGAVSFTAYHNYGNGRTSSTQEPSLIYACKCGDWRWLRLHQRSEHMLLWVPK